MVASRSAYDQAPGFLHSSTASLIQPAMAENSTQYSAVAPITMAKKEAMTPPAIKCSSLSWGIDNNNPLILSKIFFILFVIQSVIKIELDTVIDRKYIGFSPVIVHRMGIYLVLDNLCHPVYPFRIGIT